MRRRLVVSVLLDEEETDELYRRLAALVCTKGVVAWQVDCRFGEEGVGLAHEPGEGPLGEALRALDAVTA